MLNKTLTYLILHAQMLFFECLEISVHHRVLLSLLFHLFLQTTDILLQPLQTYSKFN